MGNSLWRANSYSIGREIKRKHLVKLYSMLMFPSKVIKTILVTFGVVLAYVDLIWDYGLN